MANSFISSLATLDISSVTNVESVSFFVSNADAARLARMPALGTSLVPGCIFRASAAVDQGMPSNTDKIISLGSVDHDSRSAWNTTSNYYTFDFGGWVQFKAGVRFLGAAATNPQGMLIEINSVAGTAPIHIRREENTWSLQDMTMSGPVQISSGDIVQYYARSDTVVSTVLGDGGCWLEIYVLQTNLP